MEDYDDINSEITISLNKKDKLIVGQKESKMKKDSLTTLETQKENLFSANKNRFLSVRTFNSQEIILNYDRDFSIETYKSKIKDLEGFSLESQKLFLLSRMSNENKLRDYIKKDSTFYLLENPLQLSFGNNTFCSPFHGNNLVGNLKKRIISLINFGPLYFSLMNN